MTAGRRGRPVVVGVDGSDRSAAAVRWATGYASAAGEPLRLVHAVAVTADLPPAVLLPLGEDGAGPDRPDRAADRILDAATAVAARYGPGVPVTTSAAAEPAVDALVEASRDAALLVVGSHERGRWTTQFSSVAARVVAAAHCPVVVVRGDPPPSGPVVVAVDTWGGCEQALDFAFHEAARRGLAVSAVHALQTPPVSADVGWRTAAVMTDQTSDEDFVDAQRRSLIHTVERWRAFFPDVVVHERLIPGDPETVVAGETAGAALVVVGSRGRGPIAGLFLGSTSQKLIRTSSCPVAVVRGTGHGVAGDQRPARPPDPFIPDPPGPGDIGQGEGTGGRR